MAERTSRKPLSQPARLIFRRMDLACGMGLQDVEGKPAQDGEVLGSIVHSCPAGIFVEVDIEHPVQLVLDGPMTTRNLQQPLGGHGLGEQIVAQDRRIGPIALQLPARGDVADRNNAREAVDGSQAGIAHDGCPARFAPVVGRWLERLAALRWPERANCLTTALNRGPRLALMAST